MTHRYSTAFSHLLLAGTGIYCLKFEHDANKMLSLPVMSYGIIVTHSIIGIWKWGYSDHGENADKAYRGTKFLQTIFCLPCIAGQFWINRGYHKELGYLHPAISLIPLLAYIGDRQPNEETIEVILTINAVSAGVTSFLAENYWGVASAVTFIINQLALKEDTDTFDIPSLDLYNYVLCLFTYFSLRGL